jgi:shikimate dehydrogenase
VNTVVIEGDKLLGYNTDVDGFIEPLLTMNALSGNSRAAVIGAGGAANAAVWSLKKTGVDVVLFARNAEKARLISGKVFTVMRAA